MSGSEPSSCCCRLGDGRSVGASAGFLTRQLWFTAILGGITLLSILLLFRESYGPYIQRRIVAKQDGIDDSSLRPSTRKVIVQAFTRPARMSRNPLLMVFALYYASLYGLICTAASRDRR